MAAAPWQQSNFCIGDGCSSSSNNSSSSSNNNSNSSNNNSNSSSSNNNSSNHHCNNDRSSSRNSLQLSFHRPLVSVGKLGTFLPNLYSTTDGSMFGLAISPNFNGSIIAAGAPLNTASASQPGSAMILSSLSSQTCVYSTANVPRPQGTWRYFGAQTALSSDGATLVIADGVEGHHCRGGSGEPAGGARVQASPRGHTGYFQKLNVAPRKSVHDCHGCVSDGRRQQHPGVLLSW